MPIFETIDSFNEMQFKIYDFTANKYIMLEEITIINESIQPLILIPFSFFR